MAALACSSGLGDEEGLTVTVLLRAPADSRPVRSGWLVLTVLAAVFYALGWSAAKVCAAVVWCAAAVKVGWREGRKARHEPVG
jgi:hypothetical protein